MFTKQVNLVVIIAYLSFTQIACINQQTTKIKDLYARPESYDGHKVQISGEVKDSVNIFTLKYYVVKDETGEIPVITEKAVPPTGRKVQVTGKVNQTFAIGRQSYMVIFQE